MHVGDLAQEVRRLIRPKFDFLTLFVTSTCNAKCGHCFYWKSLNSPNETFSLQDMESLAKKMPPFRILLISGGEPFLRADLPQVIQLFSNHCGIRTVSIPTNGILGDRIESLTREILRLNPGLTVLVNFSIDGFAGTHDRIRGVPRNFVMATASLERLICLRQTSPRLAVQVNTVICAANYHEVVDWAKYVAENWDVDGHYFEVIRGDPLDKGLLGVPPQELRAIYSQLLPIQRDTIRRSQARRANRLAAAWRETQASIQLLFQYRTQYNNYVSGRRWGMPCQAGSTIAVVDHYARVAVCELRTERVQLHDYDYDWKALWKNATLLRARREARSHKCDCTHVCNVQSSYQHDWRSRLISAPLSYMTYRLTGRW